jgi:hydrogenase expression/formation protein HypC
MCLGVPGRVMETEGLDLDRTARVDFGGVVKDVSLAYLPEVEVGEYVIVHVGFAISRLDEQAALETLRLFEQMGTLRENLGEEVGRA